MAGTSLRRQSGGTLQGRVDRPAQGGPGGFLNAEGRRLSDDVPVTTDARTGADPPAYLKEPLCLAISQCRKWLPSARFAGRSMEVADHGARGGHHGRDILRL